MAEAVQRGSASRADLLELKREHEVVREGHRFLDEKRVLLARELLARIRDCEALSDKYREHERDAHQALIDATGELGLEQLQLYPPHSAEGFRISRTTERFLGIPLVRLHAEGAVSDRPVRRPVLNREAADDLARRFGELLGLAVRLADAQSALLRIEAEYRKTQRRVRALEKILLPELQQAERGLEAALEEQELEEAVRVRLAAK